MKVGWGNGCLIADLHDKRLSNEEIRERWKRGEYGKPNPKLAMQWFRQAGRKGETA